MAPPVDVGVSLRFGLRGAGEAVSDPPQDSHAIPQCLA
jgi:hypothetical protein